MDWRNGTPISDYKIFKEIARGLMGVVYAARHVQTNEQAALIVLHNKDLKRGANEEHKNFLTSLESAVNLRHPNIAPIKECWKLDETYFLVSELPEGFPLLECLKSENNDSPVKKIKPLTLLRKVAGVVKEVNGQGFSQNALKLEDIIIKENGDPIILSYGWAELLGRGKKSPVLENINQYLDDQKKGATAQSRESGDRSIPRRFRKLKIGVFLLLFLGVFGFLFSAGVFSEAFRVLSKKMQVSEFEKASSLLVKNVSKENQLAQLEGLVHEYETLPMSAPLRLEMGRMYMEQELWERALEEFLIVSYLDASLFPFQSVLKLAVQYYETGDSDISDWLLDRIIEECGERETVLEALCLKNRLVLDEEALPLLRTTLAPLKGELGALPGEKGLRIFKNTQAIRLERRPYHRIEKKHVMTPLYLDQSGGRILPMPSQGGLQLAIFPRTAEKEDHEIAYMPIGGTELIALQKQDLIPSRQGDEVLAVTKDSSGSHITLLGRSNAGHPWETLIYKKVKGAISCLESILSSPESRPDLLVGVSSHYSMEDEGWKRALKAGLYRLSITQETPNKTIILESLKLWSPISGRGGALILDSCTGDFVGDQGQDAAFLVQFTGERGFQGETRIYIHNGGGECFWVHGSGVKAISRAPFESEDRDELLVDLGVEMMGAVFLK